MAGIEEQPRMGRQTRSATASIEGRRDRRRSVDGPAEEASLKLAIPTWVKEKYPETEFTHRWFAASRGRLVRASQNDWDRIEGVDEVPATDKDGNEANHVLHVKYRDWYENDRAPMEVARRETEKQMLRGTVRDRGEGDVAPLSEQHQYAEAASQNRLS